MPIILGIMPPWRDDRDKKVDWSTIMVDSAIKSFFYGFR